MRRYLKASVTQAANDPHMNPRTTGWFTINDAKSISNNFYSKALYELKELQYATNIRRFFNAYPVELRLSLLEQSLATVQAVQGVNKKMSDSFCLISLAENILKDYDIFCLKGGIHSSIWNTKIYLYDARALRCN